MTFTRSRRRWLAAVLVGSLLVGGIPLVTGDPTPDLSDVEVGELTEGDCLTLELDAEHLVEALPPADPDEFEPDPSDDQAVPMLCGTPAEALFGELIRAGNAALSELHTQLAELDRVVDEESPVGDVPFLFENFTSPRIGGLGEWDVRTAGSATGWRAPVDARVTEGFAVTDSPAGVYEHALNSTLISPAIDLGGAALDPDIASLPAQLRDLLDARIPRHMPLIGPRDDEDDGPRAGLNICLDPQENVCLGEGILRDDTEVAYQAVRRAYLLAADATLSAFAESLSAATLETRHEFNLANGLDGVRFEVLTSRPPSVGLPPIGTVLVPRRDSPRTGVDAVAAFDGKDAFTGDSDGPVIERFDLTPWAGERVWIVVRASTDPAFGVEDFFTDRALFERRTGYGFALDGVFVNVTAHEHNLRVLEIAAGQHEVDGRLLTAPPLDDHEVLVAVTNQGRAVETGTVWLAQDGASCDPPAGLTLVPPQAPAGTKLGEVRLGPGEVATFATKYPHPEVPSGRVRLVASLEASQEAASMEATPADNVLQVCSKVKRVSRLEVQDAPGTTLGLDIDPLRGDAQEPRLVRIKLRNTGNVPVAGSASIAVRDAETGAARDAFISGPADRPLKLGVGEEGTFAWSAVPSTAGIFRVEASVQAQTELVRHPSPRAHIFVERTAGVVCFEDLDTGRSCGPVWAHATELPRDVGNFASAAPGPDGGLYALTSGGEAYFSDGNAWRLVGTLGQSAQLATVPSGVVAITNAGDVALLTRDGIRPGSDFGLSGIVEVTGLSDGTVAAAGSGEGTVGIAVGDGLWWRTFTTPTSELGRSVRVTGLAQLEDGRVVLGAVIGDDTTSAAFVCEVEPAFANAAVSCPDLFPRDALREGVSIATALSDGRRPIVDVGTAGNQTLLLVESPLQPEGNCLTRAQALSGYPATYPAAGFFCAYKVLAYEDVREPAKPVPVPTTLAATKVLSFGGASWVLQTAAAASSTGIPLYRVEATARGPILTPASLPTTSALTAMGGGSRGALAVAGDDLLELEEGLPYVDNEADWRGAFHLEPQTAGKVWTTVGSKLETSIFVFTNYVDGPIKGEVLRATCGRSLEPANVPQVGLAPSTSIVPCVRITSEPPATCPTTPECRLVDSERPDWVNLTFRYNIRSLGQGPAAELRILVEPGVTSGTVVAGTVSVLPGDPIGGTDVRKAAAATYVTVENAINGQLAHAFDPACEQLGEPGGCFGATVDQRDRFDSVPEEAQAVVRQPQVVHVLQLDRVTPASWQKVEVQLNGILDLYTRAWLETRLLGLEFAFPADSEIAIDAVWLNATQKEPKREETLLCTLGARYAGPPQPTCSGAAPSKGAWTVFSALGEAARLVTDSRSTAYVAGHRTPVWRPAELTERPAWAFMGKAADNYEFVLQPTGSEALRVDRLVTPIVDLREAVRPVLTFKHAHAFPTSGTRLPGAGWVEAQIETSPGVWSQFVRLFPEGGYPRIDTDKLTLFVTGDKSGVDAYWGKSQPNDDRGHHSGVLNVSNWETATFDLFNQTVGLSGKRVRFAFTAAITAPDGLQFEGWVVTDVSVRADDRPAIDLSLAAARIEAGFDVLRTGLAPGTTALLNATIHNAGTLPNIGGLLRWELVGLGSTGEERVLSRGATSLGSLLPGRTTWITLPVTVPAAFTDPILEEDPHAFIRVELDPAGGVDEDRGNGRLTIGTAARPFPLRETRDLEVRLQVKPQLGSPSRVRTLDVLLFNSGNVPLEDILVNRSVLIEEGAAGRSDIPSETRTVRTTRPLPAGATLALSSLVEGPPISDRLWLPGRDASFVVTVEARKGPIGSRIDVPASALDPYLRATVEDPTTGIGTKDEFVPGEGWRTASPGVFDSPKAWTLRVAKASVPADGREFILDFPEVDVSAAKFATASFYHKYSFEDRFDGGRLEASADGGRTWLPLAPEEMQGKAAYGQVLGSNPMGNGNLTLGAFTGNSSKEGLDGWVLSSFDLGQVKGLVEPGEIEAFDLESLGGVSSEEVVAPPAYDDRENVYTNPSWARGSVAASRVFLVENETENPIGRGKGAPGFLYTGSGRDALLNARNALLTGHNAAVKFQIPVPDLDPDEHAVLEWWEWAPLDGSREERLSTNGAVGYASIETIQWGRYVSTSKFPLPSDTRGQRCGNWQFPVNEPMKLKLEEVDGNWRRYSVDLTAALDPSPAPREATIVFAWEPWTGTSLSTWDMDVRFIQHPGIVVDGLHLRTFKLDRAGEVDVRVRWNEDWGAGDVALYDPWLARPGGGPGLERNESGDGKSCRMWIFDVDPPTSGYENDRRHLTEATKTRAVNTTWRIVELPNDQGTSTKVFSTSALREEQPQVFNTTAFMDSRLVLPALDLGLAGGDEVTLSFDHLAAFQYFEAGGLGGIRAGGGAVELSVFDALSGRWGPWDQLYSKPRQVDNWTEDAGDHLLHDVTGGYGGKLRSLQPETAPQSDAMFKANNLPFEQHPGEPGTATEEFSRYVYGYNTCASTPDVECNELDHEWVNASYDLTPYLGKRVRLAFHAYNTGYCFYEYSWLGQTDQDANAAGFNPPNGCPIEGERWLIDNITIAGGAFAGEPLRLRLVAGLDGSVHEAQWSVDEIEVQGTAYRRNVGIYVNQKPLDLAAGKSTTIRGEVRNLGIDIRRDLALRATFDGAPADVTVDLGQGLRSTDAGEATTSPFTLAASSQRPFTVNFTLKGRGVEEGPGIVNLTLVQWNDALGILTPVSGEEVRANLQRSLGLTIHGGPAVRLSELEGHPARVEPGSISIVTLEIENPSPVSATVELTCTAARVERWEPTLHVDNEVNIPILSGDDVPCTSDLPDLITLARGKMRRAYEVRLDAPGAYFVKVQARDAAEDADLGALETVVWAGEGPRLLFEDFEGPEGEGGLAPGWDTDRALRHWGWVDEFDVSREVTTEEAYRNNWSTLSGISGSLYEQGENYPTTSDDDGPARSELRSPPIDLHNVTSGAAALSLFHMGRFAYGDGADVQVRVLRDEGSPESDSAWTRWCKLDPVGGYDGYIASWHVPQPDGDATQPRQQAGSATSPDYNPALPASDFPTQREGLYKRYGFFGSRDDKAMGPLPRFDEGWALSLFPLGVRADAPEGEGSQALTCADDTLLGSTVQFRFTLYAGEDDGEPPAPLEVPDPLMRGRGQGWFIDSVVVAAANVSVTPRQVQVPLLDNATKVFPVHVSNHGGATERPRIVVDLDRSTVTGDEAQADETLSVEPNESAIGLARVTLPRDPLALPFRHTVVVRTDGLIDLNTQPTTVLRLDFDPRVWPDLGVTLLDPSEAPIEGVPAILPVQVTNHGRRVAPPSSLVLRDTFEGETTETVVQVQAIPSPSADPLAATTVVYVPWTPERGSAGTHTIEVELDPEGLLEQYTRADDRTKRTFEVQRLVIPDLRFDEANLTIGAIGADIERLARGTVVTYTVTVGTLTTLSVPVTNAGTATATNVDVRLFLGSVVLPAKRISRLEPGDVAPVSFTFLAQEGTYAVSLEVTSGSRDLVPEDNKAPLVGALRLIASSFRVEIELPETIETAATGVFDNVTMVLKNRGALGLLLDVGSAGPRGVRYVPGADQVFLGAGESVSLPGRVFVDVATDGGSHPLGIVVADHDAPAHEVLRTLVVHLAERHDLAISAGTDALTPGPGALPLRIANRGNLAEAFTIEPRMGDAPAGPPTRVTIPRGAEVALELPIDVPHAAAAGPHRLVLDIHGTHVATYPFDVRIEALARPVFSTLAGEEAFGPQGLVVPFSIENVGNMPLSASLGVRDTGLPAGSRVSPASVALAPGESLVAALIVPGGNASEAELVVEDIGGTVLASQVVRLPADRPDVLVLRHTMDPASPAEGELTRLSVTVGNVGDVAARDVPVELFIDDEFAVRGILGAVGPGESRAVTFEWPAFAGRHVASVVVDPGSRVPDSDAANNIVSVHTQAPTGALDVARLVERARDAPTLGPLWIMAALAAALLLSSVTRGNASNRGARRGGSYK